MRYVLTEGSKKNWWNRAFLPASESSSLCPTDTAAGGPGTFVPLIENWRCCFCLSRWLQVFGGLQEEASLARSASLIKWNAKVKEWKERKWKEEKINVEEEIFQHFMEEQDQDHEIHVTACVWDVGCGTCRECAPESQWQNSKRVSRCPHGQSHARQGDGFQCSHPTVTLLPAAVIL